MVLDWLGMLLAIGAAVLLWNNLTLAPGYTSDQRVFAIAVVLVPLAIGKALRFILSGEFRLL
jgi:hypothetical protein